MNKLNKVLVALFALGVVVAAEAGCKTKCYKPKCAPKCEKVEKKCPKVEETCVERTEFCEGEECVTVKRPIYYERKCYDKTKCVTTECCDKKGWVCVRKGEAFVPAEDCNVCESACK